jgi:acetyl-CoA synthetase
VVQEVFKKAKTAKSNSNIGNYENTYNSFSWQDAEKLLYGLPKNQGLNMAYEAIDYHADDSETKHRVALRFIRNSGDIQDYTYDRLKRHSNKFANILKELQLQKGDRVFALCPRIPELYISLFGALKNLNVFCPLFSAFGPEPIKARMIKGDAKVLITTESLYFKKVKQIQDKIPTLKKIILIPDLKVRDETLKSDQSILWFDHLLKSASDKFTIPPTNPQDMALIHFTSGTTGMPKGAIHAHRAILVHSMTGKFALDMHSKDVFWCTADPGWVTGTSYGILSPLVNKVLNIVVENEFNAHQWIQILREHKINIWYTAPTAIRMLMKSDINENLPIELKDLRYIASVGEPLNPAAINWGVKAFNKPIHDNWWQSETGGIMISNYPSMDIKLGSMGRPLPGVEASIVEVDKNGKLKHLPTGAEGILALKKGWPSMFTGYLHQEDKYQSTFKEGYYLTGDLAKKDREGYFWFVGRDDDVIKTAGHLVGPFEIESAFMDHPAIAEAAMIGIPDEVAGNIIKAFVVLKNEFTQSSNLTQDILATVRKKLGASVAPKEIEYIDDLPKTRSGKIMRRLLKAKELGLPEGDTSALIVEQK